LVDAKPIFPLKEAGNITLAMPTFELEEYLSLKMKNDEIYILGIHLI